MPRKSQAQKDLEKTISQVGSTILANPTVQISLFYLLISSIKDFTTTPGTYETATQASELLVEFYKGLWKLLPLPPGKELVGFDIQALAAGNKFALLEGALLIAIPLSALAGFKGNIGSLIGEVIK